MKLIALAVLIAALTATTAQAARPPLGGDSPAPAVTLQTVVSAALSDAGAPTSTPVTCTPSVPQGEDGWAQWSPSAWIELSPDTCTDLLWLEAPQWQRDQIEAAAPFTLWVGGVGALVLLHEATHIAGDHDETDTECQALKLLPDFLAQYLSGDQLEHALRVANTRDSFLPSLYHQHSC